MKGFREYLGSGIVKKQTPNIARAKSLINEAMKKKQYLEVSMSTIPKAKWNPNVMSEQCYDILMELIRAKMFMDGYNAPSSHEAEVSYMNILGFSEADAKYMDELRYYRNGMKYYGTILNMEYAEKTIRFLDKIYPRLMKLLK